MTNKKIEVQGISLDMPFVGVHHVVNVHMSIDCKFHIDPYDYHDAPSSLSIWLSLEELKLLKGMIDDTIAAAEDFQGAQP